MTLPSWWWKRFVPKVEVGDCWLWTGARHWGRGYGRFHLNGAKYAHRVSYETLVGRIPDGLVLDHLCRVRLCVNPDHLEPVTAAENSRRGLMRARCKWNHEPNWRPRSGGGRYCATCVQINNRKRRSHRDPT